MEAQIIFSMLLVAAALGGMFWAFISMFTTKKLRMTLFTVVVLLGLFGVVTYARNNKAPQVYRVDNVTYVINK